MLISKIEAEKLDKGLGIFIEVFRPYVISILTERFGQNWNDEFTQLLTDKQRENWERDLRKGKKPENLIDFQYFKSFALNKENQKLLRHNFDYETTNLPTWLSEINEVRNSLKHYDDSLEKNKAMKAWIHLQEIAKLIGQDEVEEKLSNLQNNSSVQINVSIPKIITALTPKKIEKRFTNVIQHSIETLDIVNCSGLWQQVFAEEVYICPAGGGAYSHRQCRYFGAYFDKRIGAVGEIEAVVDVNSEDEAEVYWTNYNQDVDDYLERAKEKAAELRPDEFPIRVFLLKDLYSTNFVKDSKGGMQASKMYLNIEDLDISNAKELAEKLDGMIWSNLNL